MCTSWAGVKNASHELVKLLSWDVLLGADGSYSCPPHSQHPGSPREQLSPQPKCQVRPWLGNDMGACKLCGGCKGYSYCLLLKWKEHLLAVCVPSPRPSLLPLPAFPGESHVVGRNPHPAWAQGPGYVDADLRFTQYYGKSAGRAKDQSSLVVRKSMGSGISI